MTSPALVSVKVPAYNQERYLEACLDGILSQKTSFPFEVVIGEDGSPDGTRGIAETYAQAHPDRVRLLPAEGNLGPARNLARIRAACRGTYEAMCEGDDIWIHPHKLQRQVEFLESRPDYVFCFHDTLFCREDKGVRPRYYCPRDLPESPTVADVLRRPAFIATSSILARRSFLDALPPWPSAAILSSACGAPMPGGSAICRISWRSAAGTPAAFRCAPVPGAWQRKPSRPTPFSTKPPITSITRWSGPAWLSSGSMRASGRWPICGIPGRPGSASRPITPVRGFERPHATENPAGRIPRPL